MKNALLVLALGASFLAASCRRDPPSPVPTPPPPAEPVREQPLEAGAPPDAGLDAGSGGAPDAGAGDDAGTGAALGPEVQSCVDAWLAKRNLDQYGHEKGTMYTGGTPLFDERTGETTDRMVYVFRKHPDAKAACAPDVRVPGRLPEK